MEIRATGKLDEQSVTVLSAFCVFKKYDIKKIILAIAAIAVIPTLYTAIRLMILTRFRETTDPMQLVTAAIPLIVILIIMVIPIMLSSFKAQKFKKLQNASFSYTFYDGSVSVICTSISGTKTFSIRYSELTIVGESSKNFFICHGKESYIVDKSTFENGTADHLRHRFSSMENIKYISCKY